LIILATPRRFRSVGQWYNVPSGSSTGRPTWLAAASAKAAVGPAHAATALRPNAHPRLRPPQVPLLSPAADTAVVQALQPAPGKAAQTPLALRSLISPLGLALPVGTEEEQQVFALARRQHLASPSSGVEAQPTGRRTCDMEQSPQPRCIKWCVTVELQARETRETSPVRKPSLQDTTRLPGVVFPCTGTANRCKQVGYHNRTAGACAPGFTRLAKNHRAGRAACPSIMMPSVVAVSHGGVAKFPT